MKFETKSVLSQPEILKKKLGGELLENITITDTALTSAGVVKGGSPIAADGTIANDGTAVGILINDVYAENPNGSILKAFGVINLANANANAGITIADTVKTALAEVVFE